MDELPAKLDFGQLTSVESKLRKHFNSNFVVTVLTN